MIPFYLGLQRAGKYSPRNFITGVDCRSNQQPLDRFVASTFQSKEAVNARRCITSGIGMIGNVSDAYSAAVLANTLTLSKSKDRAQIMKTLERLAIVQGAYTRACVRTRYHGSYV